MVPDARMGLPGAAATEGYKMKCSIVCRAVPGSCGAAMTTEALCETHNMPMGDTVSQGDLCPIGKIEAATEAALEAIERAKR